MSLIELLNSSSGGEMRSKIFGVVVGIVIDIQDPLGLGRVKVDYTWLAEKGAETVAMEKDKGRAHSQWARVMSFMAGAKRGGYFMPEPNDEVLVAFEHGEMDRPIVLGGLWNKEDAPPESMDGDGKNNVRSIHSRSGHKFTFNDSDDAPSVQIIDQTGKNSITIDSKNKKMIIAVDGDLEIKAGGKISISAGQNMDIRTDAALTVTAQSSGKIETTSALDIKSDATLTVSGMSTTVKGTTVNINGSGVTEVKGGIVKIN
ncbi:phage tail protein [bacterium]|nr:phage tail protein [bacterium]